MARSLLTTSWCDGQPIIFLYTDGFRDFYGVRSEQFGDVVSRVQLRPSDEINRKAQIERTSINELLDILEESNEETDNANDLNAARN